jgi:MFS transporter, ACS family, hexuronate transporter
MTPAARERSASAEKGAGPGSGHLRWYICGLLFFATTVNYMDRQVLGILKPVLSRDLHWNEADFGWIIFAFQLSYAFMMPIAGRVMDWLGTRLGYALAVLVWSLASMSHAIAGNVFQFAAARFGLGIGESANFPAAVKTVAEWFPKRERALATGLFNSGSNLGAIAAPLVVPFVARAFGWRSAFVVTGGLDLIWIAVWLAYYNSPRRHRALKASELAWIESDREDAAARRISWSGLVGKRSAWAILVAKFMTDPVWWFYLYWLPGFLSAKFHVDLTALGPPLIVIYVAADGGSILGGWYSSFLLKRGWSVNAARKTAMLTCAIAVVSAAFIFAARGNLWLTVALVGIAAAAHQGWSANVYTLASDLFPRSAVGSVVGLAGFGGAVGGMLAAPAVGYWLDFSKGAYAPLFFIAGSMYLLALLLVQLLAPRIPESAPSLEPEA